VSTARRRTIGTRVDAARAFRAAALACVLVLTGSYVSVLQSVAVVVGDSSSVVPITVLSLAGATAVAKYVSERTAITVTVVLAVVGYSWYLQTTGASIAVVFEYWRLLLADAVTLLTGLSVIQLANAEAWAVGSVPAPVFLSWYLAMRRRYAAAAAVGGGTLLAFVLTGDAGTMVTLAGVVAAAGAVGFGELERRDATFQQADVLAVLFAAMAVLSLTVTVIPAGEGSPLTLHGTSGVGSQEQTIESSITNSPEQYEIQGSIELSPEVRFTVRSDEPANWRTGTYDRFTGSGWHRTAGASEYDDGIASPPGPRSTVEQTYVMESPMGVMPAANQPIRVSGDVAAATSVTDHGSLQYDGTFESGASYRVVSSRPAATPEELRAAGTDYPDEIAERYLQLPADQPDRFGRAASRITADAENPYDSAVAVERYLENEKEYSLDVERPEGNVADAFLFEMNAGYCTYFATTMATMLREEGIPARMVTGYSTGQQVGDDRYVVRGLNSHAWVEVYFPEHGWVTFDPTPSEARQDARTDRVEDARANQNRDVDTEESRGRPLERDESTEPEPGNESTDNETTRDNESTDTDLDRANSSSPSLDEFDESGSGGEDGDEPREWLPDRETAGIGLVVLVGVVAGVRRSGHAARAARAIRLRWHRRGETPQEDVRRSFERLELLLADDHRPRAPAETPREYLATVAGEDPDPRVERLRGLYERAHYGGSVSADDAAEAAALVDELVGERTRLP